MSGVKIATATGKKPPAMSAGKKQAALPRPKKAGRVGVGKKKAAVEKKPRSKGKKPALAFSTVESRQKALERVKRAIWCRMSDINEGIIRLAISGNYLAAKALFDMAGVYSLPPLDEQEPSGVAAAPQMDSCARAELPPKIPPVNAVETFFKSLGIEPPGEDPEPDMAA